MIQTKLTGWVVAEAGTGTPTRGAGDREGLRDRRATEAAARLSTGVRPADVSVTKSPGPLAPPDGPRMVAIQEAVRSDDRILAAWIFGSRYTGIRRDCGKVDPPDIDLAVRLDWPTKYAQHVELGAAVRSRWNVLLQALRIEIDWNGRGDAADAYHLAGLQIWPPARPLPCANATSHAAIWAALDALAGDRGFSPSGLAKRSGLDPTTFNRSKRVRVDGELRWPSIGAIARVLDATVTTWTEFAELVECQLPPPQHDG